MTNKRTDDFYMADSFDRVSNLAYCSATCDNVIGTAVKGINSLNTVTANSVDTIAWEPMATVASVDSLSDKVAEMAKSLAELKKSFEAVNSKPLRHLRSELRTLDARRYSNDFTRAM